MDDKQVRLIARWVLASLALAAAMVIEAHLQLGGRSAAITACLVATVAWATALVWFGRRLKLQR